MRNKVNNRWIYAHLGAVRWIRKHGAWAWLLYPSLYISMRLLFLSFDLSDRAMARSLKDKGGDIEQDS